MATKTKHPHLLYLLFAPVVGLLTVVLRAVALLTVYNAENGFYDAATLPIVTAVALAVLTLALAVFSYESRVHLSFGRDYRDLPTLFSGIFLAIMLLFFGGTLLAGALDRPLSILIPAVLASVAAIGGALLFAVRAFDGAAEGAAKAMLSLPAAALGVLFPLYLSTETSLTLNAPVKLLGIVTWVTVAFFFLGEARIALGRAKWAVHSFFTVITAVFTATLSIPNLIYHAVSGAPLLGNTAHDFAALGVCLYALARLISTVTYALRQSDPEVAALAGAEAEHGKEEPNEEATDR